MRRSGRTGGWMFALATAALVLASPLQARAYSLIGLQWPAAEAPIATGNLNDTTWRAAFNQAATRWSVASPFSWDVQGLTTVRSFCSAGDDNVARFDTSVCGASFGGTTLAVMAPWESGQNPGIFAKIEIVYDSNEAWAVYDGPLQSASDFKRVTVHELGHAMGLDHTTVSGSIMLPEISNSTHPGADDLAGIDYLYGEAEPPAQTEANLHVSSASGYPGAFITEGPAGGPFSPLQQRIRLKNTSNSETLQWEAQMIQSWLLTTSTQGTLSPGAETTVTVTVDAQALTALEGGHYYASAVFINKTNGRGSTTKSFQAVITDKLEVTKPQFITGGPPGGPFDPPSATYRLTNTTGSPISWEVRDNTIDWAAISPSSGTVASGQTVDVTATVNASANALVSGDYQGSFNLRDLTHGRDHTRGASLSVYPDTTITVHPEEPARFAYIPDPTVPGQSISHEIATTTSPGTWVNITAPDWIVNDLDGLSVTSRYVQGSLRIRWFQSATGRALPNGEYHGQIVYQERNAAGSFVRDVTLVRRDALPGRISVGPAFGLHTRAAQEFSTPSPWSVVYAVTNQGELPVSYTVAESVNWLETVRYVDDNGFPLPVPDDLRGITGAAASAAGVPGGSGGAHDQQIDCPCPTWPNGTIGPGQTHEVIVRSNGFGQGYYETDVVFTNTTNGLGSTSRPASLAVAVQLPSQMSVTPPGAYIAEGAQGGQFLPALASYTITNAGEETMQFEATTDAPWLQVIPSTGSIAGGQSATVEVQASGYASTLAIGMHYGTVNITNLTNGRGNTVRQAELEVRESLPGRLYVTPGNDFYSSGNAGGPFQPLAFSYTLSNTGDQPISWTASSDVDWAQPNQASGYLSGGQSIPVTVALTPSANTVPAGLHNGTLTLMNETNGSGATVRFLRLDAIDAPSVLQVSGTQSPSFSGDRGGPFTPTSEVYTLSNSGNLAIDFEVVAGAPWLDVLNGSGTLPSGGETTVTLSPNTAASELAAGVYNTTLSFINHTNGFGSVSRSVELIAATTPGRMVVEPGDSLSASGPRSGPFTATPGTYTVTNTGDQSFLLSISANVSWLVATPNARWIAPGESVDITVVVTEFASNLPVGNHMGKLTFANTSSNLGSTERIADLAILGFPLATETFEYGLPQGWTKPTAAAGGWNVSTDQRYNGAYSLRADALEHSETAAIEYTGTFPPGSLSFALRVHSEADFDFLRFLVDGEERVSGDGFQDWFRIEDSPVGLLRLDGGEHHLEWRYIKDDSLSVGFDTAWIDDVVFYPDHFCGDGTTNPGELCDDGDFSNHDECAADCSGACGDMSGDGMLTAVDALAVLRVAVGFLQCPPGTIDLCDVDGSGSTVAVDALITLRKAIGSGGAMLCPPR